MRRRRSTTDVPTEDTTTPAGTAATIVATVRGWFTRSTEDDLTDSQVLDVLLDQVHQLRCQVADLATTLALTSSSVDSIELSVGDLATAGTRD